MIARVLSLSLVVAVLAWPPEATSQPARQQGMSGQAQSVPRALSEEQAARMRAILAPYSASTLTVGDAKTIKRALRDAGMRPSPELDAALRAQGFSPERLDELDPRPSGPPVAGEAAGKGPKQVPGSPSSTSDPTK